MLISLCRDIPAKPAAVWPLISDPERMNRWSTARIAPVAPGDGGRFDAVGALRSVRIAMPGRAMLLEEVIEEARPPLRLVYRVFAGGGIRSHRGVVALDEVEGGAATRLRWEVRADFVAPGLGALAKILLERELGKSLDALARFAAADPAPSRAEASREARAEALLDETAELPGLYEEAARIVAAQRAIADDLEARRDPKRWFPRVYEFVSEAQVAACRAGRFRHPAWVLRLLPAFHAYFATNLERALGRAPGAVESHWRSAFRAMDEGESWFPRDPLRASLYGVAKGMQAHIEEDLPRALAEVYARSYEGRCDYARFRADYLAMAPVFGEAGDRLMARIPASQVPLRSRLLRAVLPREAIDALLADRFYDIAKERRRAFERGERIAAMLMAERRGARTS